MPTTEIITIINNSGKIISTGKHLVNIFKDAKATYKERKSALKAERIGIQRAKTFDVAPRSHYQPHRGHPDDRYDDEYTYYEDERDHHVGAIDQQHRRALRNGSEAGSRASRRRSHDDDNDDRVSHASSRHSHRSRRSHRPDEPRSSSRPRTLLTADNLKTHSEVSATPPSAAPKPYRSPYAETAPHDMQLSRPALVHAATMPTPSTFTAQPPAASRSQTSLVVAPKKKKSIDMHLAYGNIPPDLASREDLEALHDDDTNKNGEEEEPEPQEAEALTLIDRIEGMLDEAHCIQHTASSMIANLQENPQAAAAVALTLAELSTLLGKMSPAFLGFLKGGSPAIFALLASPQFLIGTSIALGVTVVMFGGWKIVKKIAEGNNREREKPFEMAIMSGANGDAAAPPAALPPPPPEQVKSEASYEEALVLEEELSTIESWRRGISPSFVGEEADVELMSPEADRALRKKYRGDEEGESDDDEVVPDDSISRIGRSHRSHRRRHHHHRDAETEIPERKSSKHYNLKTKDGAAASEVAESVRSHRSHRSSSSRKERDEAASEVSHRSSSSRKDRDREDGASSEVSHRSHRSTASSSASRSSKRTSTRIGLKVIEDGDEEEGAEAVVTKTKEKKVNMLKQLFKKKKKEGDEKEREKERERAVSVLV